MIENYFDLVHTLIFTGLFKNESENHSDSEDKILLFVQVWSF